MSGLLSRPLSPIIKSPPTTPQKQPASHQDRPNAGFQPLHPPPSSQHEPKSVRWGDLVAYRTIETRQDDEGRSPDTEEEADMTVRIDPKRFSDQSNISTATSSSLFSTASTTSASGGEDLPPLSAEGIRLEAEKVGKKKRRSGTKDLFKRYVERFRPAKIAEEKDVVQIIYEDKDGATNEPVVSILNPSPEPMQTGRVYDSPSSSGNPSTLTPPPSLMSNPIGSGGRSPSPRHQRSASIFIPPRRVDTPTLGLTKGNQPVPPILERQARISGTFGPPKGSAVVPDEVKGKGQTETVRAALQPFPGVVLDLGPALPISDEKQVLTDTASGSAVSDAPDRTGTAQEKSPNSQARDLGWIRVPRGRPAFGMSRRTLSDPNIPTIYESEPLKTDDLDLESEGNGRAGARDRHEVVRMLKEELTYGDEDPVESHSSGSTGPPKVATPIHEERHAKEAERKQTEVETPARPHTAWDHWRRPALPQTGLSKYPGADGQADARQRKLSLNKDLPRLPVRDVPRGEPEQMRWNDPRQLVDQRSDFGRDKNVGWHAWKWERRESMKHQPDTGTQHRARSPLVSPRGHEFTRFSSPAPISPHQQHAAMSLARPATPMPPSSSSMPLLLASALLSQQASQILIELSAIPAAGPEDDKLDSFKSRMRQLATEGHEVGRGLMDCVISQEPDAIALPARPASANALKRARSDLSGINQDAMVPDKRFRRISLPADMHFSQPVHLAYQEPRAVSPRYNHREDARQNEMWRMQAMLDQAHEMIQGLQANLNVLRPDVGPDSDARIYEHDRGRRRRTFWGGWSRR